MNLFAFVLLIERHNSQDGRGDHARAVYPGHCFVKFYRTALFGSGNSGSANGVIGGDSVQVAGERTQSNVQIANSCAFTFAASTRTEDHRRNERYRRDQTHPLMDLQRVRLYPAAPAPGGFLESVLE